MDRYRRCGTLGYFLGTCCRSVVAGCLSAYFFVVKTPVSERRNTTLLGVALAIGWAALLGPGLMVNGVSFPDVVMTRREGVACRIPVIWKTGNPFSFFMLDL